MKVNKQRGKYLMVTITFTLMVFISNLNELNIIVPKTCLVMRRRCEKTIEQILYEFSATFTQFHSYLAKVK